MFKVRDLMTRDIVSVKPSTPIYEAMQILVDHGVTGLPVVAEDGTLQGIVSEKDMLRLLYEEHVENQPVEKYMTRRVVAFEEDDTLIDVCEALIQNNFRRVPILKDGKLVGIISRSDIIRYILKLRTTR